LHAAVPEPECWALQAAELGGLKIFGTGRWRILRDLGGHLVCGIRSAASHWVSLAGARRPRVRAGAASAASGLSLLVERAQAVRLRRVGSEGLAGGIAVGLAVLLFHVKGEPTIAPPRTAALPAWLAVWGVKGAANAAAVYALASVLSKLGH